jgi:hypothetical protein
MVFLFFSVYIMDFEGLKTFAWHVVTFLNLESKKEFDSTSCQSIFNSIIISFIRFKKIFMLM